MFIHFIRVYLMIVFILTLGLRGGFLPEESLWDQQEKNSEGMNESSLWWAAECN